jgi:hypothetical protein
MKLKTITVDRIDYAKLNPRQQERFNYQKAGAILADYGFATYKLDDDWKGADFIAQHIDLEVYLKVQLKSRLAFDKKYLGKDIYIMFRDENNWYLYPHDEVLEKISAFHNMKNTDSWSTKGGYNFPSISKEVQKILSEYLL